MNWKQSMQRKQEVTIKVLLMQVCVSWGCTTPVEATPITEGKIIHKTPSDRINAVQRIKGFVEVNSLPLMKFHHGQVQLSVFNFCGEY